MPWDLLRNTKYYFDYPYLIGYFTEHLSSYFHDQTAAKVYFSQWASLLQECDRHNSRYYLERNPDQRKDPELFQHTQWIAGSAVYLHFDISYTLYRFRPYMDNYHEKDIRLFFSDQPLIFWTSPDDFSEKYPLDPAPVITVPLPGDFSRQLVIDGNHRIAKYIIDNRQTIPVCSLTLDDVLTHKLLACKFDFAFYFFIADMNKIMSANFCSDSEIFKHSFYDKVKNECL